MTTLYAEMLRYNHWANLTLFKACRQLGDDQLDTRAPGTPASVRDLLTHIAGGQQTVIARSMGQQHSSWDAWHGFDALVDLTTRTHVELMSIAESIEDDAAVEVPDGDQVYLFPASFFLVLAMAHGVEHRTEIKVALNAIGVETPDLDSWSYAAASGWARER